MVKTIGLSVLFTWCLCMATVFGKEWQGKVLDSRDGSVVIGASVLNQRTKVAVQTGQDGGFRIDGEVGDKLLVSMLGFEAQTIRLKKQQALVVYIQSSAALLEEVVIVGYQGQATLSAKSNGVRIRGVARPHSQNVNAESYRVINENTFQNPIKEPLSTFAVDVDAASYSNMRRMLKMGEIPPADAVRVEELINYFQYDLEAPQGGDPVRIVTELTTAPWNPQHQLLRISLKAKDVAKEKLSPSNFVFLIDVSGSMFAANKLPLVKSSLKMLVDQLRSMDRVAIVTYAGSASVKLESTRGDQKIKIKDAIDALEAGGSTAGGAGIRKAYDIARTNFIKEGNNRIIMATDGDFNVGASSDQEMETIIERERESGVNISILGYGMGNYKDSKMEILADKGRGNYAYIDNITEARKAIITEFGGTLFTVAKDVKIQVEFNPDHVQAYRLVGYENRLMEAEDFNNDTKVGGDMGVGHTVTALYEVVPTGVRSALIGTVDKLKYQEVSNPVRRTSSDELATVKFRYKEPQGDMSKLKEVIVVNHVIPLEKVSSDFRFASAVAEFGMLLRNSTFKQEASFSSLIGRARAAKGQDLEGYRMEFIRMAEDTEALMKGVLNED